MSIKPILTETVGGWLLGHMLELLKRDLAPCSFPTPLLLPLATSHLVGKDESKSPGKFYEAPFWMSWINCRLLASLQNKQFLVQPRNMLSIGESLGTAGRLISVIYSSLSIGVYGHS